MLKNKKGLTLVELVCTLAISGFLLIGLSTAIATMGAQYVRIMDSTRAKANATVMLETIEPALRAASGGLITNEMPSGYVYSWYKETDGKFKQKNNGTVTELFDSSLYGYFDYDMQYFLINKSTLLCEVRVYDKRHKVLYKGSSTISLLNTNPADWSGVKTVKSSVGKGAGAILAFNK